MRRLLLLCYLGGLLFFSLRLRKTEARRIRTTEEFLFLLRRVRREVACYARPLSEICRSVDLPLLRAAGLFDAPDPGDPRAAFRAALPALSLPPDAPPVLDAFFTGAGAPTPDEEAAACDRAIAELEAILSREKTEGANRVRLRSTLIISGGLMFLLLVL